MTTFETSNIHLYSSENEQKQDGLESSNSDETDNEIPYHAREYARPFTYGKLPKGFTKSHLNHVELKDLPNSFDVSQTPDPVCISSPSTDFNDLFDNPNWAIRASPIPPLSPNSHQDNYIDVYQAETLSVSKQPANNAFNFSHSNFEESAGQTTQIKRKPILPPSPSTQRKNTRPSISPCRPVLRKTPSRQEFEEMLEERRQQSLREENLAYKEEQNASIRKDLDELQEKLNKTKIFQVHDSVGQNKLSPCREIVKLVETIDLPDEKVEDNTSIQSTEIVENASQCELALVALDIARPETPAFPTNSKSALEDRCISPYPMIAYNSPVMSRANPPAAIQSEKNVPFKGTANLFSKLQTKSKIKNIQETPHDVASHFVKFVKDSSEFWYKPYMTREEAVAILRKAPPGTFIIRNSTTYKDAFGLVIRVAKPPPGASTSDNQANRDVLVRHFLIEPTTRGVRLKGCINEPTFTSLSAFVYQHSINPLALPCKLIIPTKDLQLSDEDSELIQHQKLLLDQGAACNVLYLFTMNMESLTGDEAVRKAIHQMYVQPGQHAPIEVHFKVSQNGITLTDNKRRLFFRRHYTPTNISHIGIDPDNRFYTVMSHEGDRVSNQTIFAFVAKPSSGSRDNQCHVFCDLAPTQPASAIVTFAQKMLHLNLNEKIV